MQMIVGMKKKLLKKKKNRVSEIFKRV